jgi:hypothetical protein
MRESEHPMFGRWRICVFVIAAAAIPAHAQNAGGDLFRWCTTRPATVAAANPACANYIYGVLDQLPSGSAAAPLRKKTCFPAVMTPGQANAIVENYLRNHPERRSASPAMVRAEAFNAAFPCRTN